MYGGAEAHAISIMKELTSKGIRLQLVCLGRETEKLYSNYIDTSISIVCIDSTERFGRLASLYRQLRHLKPDYLLLIKGTLKTGSFTEDFIYRICSKRFCTLLQVRPSQVPKIPTRKHFFGLVSGFGVWRWRLLLHGWLRGIFPHKTICVSDSIRSYLVDVYRYSHARTVTVRNGIDISKNEDCPDARAEILFRSGFPANSVLVGTSCRLSEEKGLVSGIESFRIIANEFPESNARWVIFGKGPEYESLKTLVSGLNLEDRVFLWGFEPNVRRYLAAFQIFFLPSQREGLPLSVLEAMWAGCLPVVSNVDGIPEILAGAEVGKMHSPNEFRLFANGIVEYASLEKSPLGILRGLARKRVRDHFSHADKLNELLECFENE